MRAFFGLSDDGGTKFAINVHGHVTAIKPKHVVTADSGTCFWRFAIGVTALIRLLLIVTARF